MVKKAAYSAEFKLRVICHTTTLIKKVSFLSSSTIAGRNQLFGLGLTFWLGLLCLPSEPYAWLSFLLLVPYGFALRGVGPYGGFLRGAAYGSCIWAAGSWWLHSAFSAMLQIPEISAWGMTALFWLYQALPYALLGWIHGWMNKRKLTPGPLFSASAFTLLVALRTEISPGTVHQALATMPQLIQVADLGGRLLVFFVLVLANWLLVEALAEKRSLQHMGKYCALFLLLLASVWGYGNWKMHTLHRQEEQASAADFLKISAVQPFVRPLAKEIADAATAMDATAEQLVALQHETNNRFPDADLTLWPELPQELPCSCAKFRNWGIDDEVTASRIPLLLACTELRDDPSKHNSAWSVYPDGNCGLAYRKLELAPFGEYLPLKKELQKLGVMSGSPPRYLPGSELMLLDLPNGKRVQPLICYESGFPQLVRKGVALGANLLAVLSDDIWFDSARGEAMHLDMTLFRAVEFRRPLVSCTNSGISAHVRATGEIVPGTLTRSGERTATHAALYCPKTRTVYDRFGERWLWFCVLWLGLRLLQLRVWKTRTAH